MAARTINTLKPLNYLRIQMLLAKL